MTALTTIDGDTGSAGVARAGGSVTTRSRVAGRTVTAGTLGVGVTDVGASPCVVCRERQRTTSQETRKGRIKPRFGALTDALAVKATRSLKALSHTLRRGRARVTGLALPVDIPRSTTAGVPSTPGRSGSSGLGGAAGDGARGGSCLGLLGRGSLGDLSRGRRLFSVVCDTLGSAQDRPRYFLHAAMPFAETTRLTTEEVEGVLGDHGHGGPFLLRRCL
jgi:hypothetical protein